EDAELLQVLGVVSDNPAMIWAIITVGSPRKVNHPADEQQTGTLNLALRVKMDITIRAAIACALNHGINDDRAVWSLVVGGNVNRVQPLHLCERQVMLFLGHVHLINFSVDYIIY